MSMNNVIPFWVLELDQKATELSIEEMVTWLKDNRSIPEPVRQQQLEHYQSLLEQDDDRAD